MEVRNRMRSFRWFIKKVLQSGDRAHRYCQFYYFHHYKLFCREMIHLKDLLQLLSVMYGFVSFSVFIIRGFGVRFCCYFSRGKYDFVFPFS